MRQEILDADEHFKLTVEGKERLQQVLLRPEAALFHRPLPGVLEWEENIVHMDDHAGL